MRSQIRPTVVILKSKRGRMDGWMDGSKEGKKEGTEV